MKRVLLPLLFLSALGLMILVAYLPVPVRPLDFQVIYHADMGLMRGIQLYDRNGQAQMIANLAGVTPDQVVLYPFPYPPWYALTALPLAFLPIRAATRLWLELNVAMLMLAVWLLTEGWKPRARLAAFPLSLIFVPVLGALFVGQYVFPVLLGMSLLIYALRHENPLLTALAVALLTFKPHLGGLTLLAGMVYLWFHRDGFGRRALISTVLMGVFLFIVGFLADSAWPLNYFHSITGYGQISGVQSCKICASLPVTVANWFDVQGIGSAFWIGGVLLLLLSGLMTWKRPLWKSPGGIVAKATLVTLLVSPYLLNYDFILLLIPLFFLAGRMENWLDWLLVGIGYFLPLLGLGLFGRQGNITLILAAVLLMVWLFLRENLPVSTLPTLHNQKFDLRER
jgi:hypothetical protein